MYIANSILAAFSFFSLAVADVKFTTPSPGATVAGGSTISIEWTDSGTAPSISDLVSYQLFLCAGSNDSPTPLVPLQTQGKFADGNAASGAIQASLGESITNAYFLKMISVGAAGGTVINYSARFSLSGMTGTFPDAVRTGLKSVSGTSGPPTVNDVKAGGAVPNGANGPFGVPYAMQTGPTRYAAMAKQPPTKISKQKVVPQNPTSAFSLATAPLARASVTTTIFQSQTFSAASHVNQASPMPKPNDMQRFLDRWKD